MDSVNSKAISDSRLRGTADMQEHVYVLAGQGTERRMVAQLPSKWFGKPDCANSSFMDRPDAREIHFSQD